MSPPPSRRQKREGAIFRIASRQHFFRCTPSTSKNRVEKSKKFGYSFFLLIFAVAIAKRTQSIFAEIAQLVERNLAKVEVAGPSPVFRSEVLFEGPFFVGQGYAN